MKVHNPQKAEKFAESFANAYSQLDIRKLTTPTNLDGAKAHWLYKAERGSFTSPQFEYDSKLLLAASNNIKNVRTSYLGLINLLEPETELDEAILGILARRAQEALLIGNLAASIALRDDRQTANIAQSLYVLPSSAQFLDAFEHMDSSKTTRRPEAQPILKTQNYEKFNAEFFNAEQVSILMNFALNLYGFDWQCKLAKDNSNIVRKNYKRGIITIPKHTKLNANQLTQLVAHEVDCHIRSFENARTWIEEIITTSGAICLLPLAKVLSLATDNYYYRGCAKLTDVRLLGDEAKPSPLFVTAGYYALKGLSFGEIAEWLYEHELSDHDDEKETYKKLNIVWNVAYQTFQGCTDTRNWDNTHYFFPNAWRDWVGYEAAKETPVTYRHFSSLNISEIELLMSVTDEPHEPKHKPYTAANNIYRRYLKNPSLMKKELLIDPKH